MLLCTSQDVKPMTPNLHRPDITTLVDQVFVVVVVFVFYFYFLIAKMCISIFKKTNSKICLAITFEQQLQI